MTTTLYVNKYKPTQVKDILGLPKKIFDLYDSNGLKNHISLIGIEGMGKSLTSECLVRETGCNNLIINVSDERGIDIVRNKIKEFAMTRSTNGKQKIIQLEEMDSMTQEAQRALRFTIEKYANNAKYILTANFKSSIISPLLSRCPSIEIEANDEDIVNHLKNICVKESIEYEENALKEIVKRFKPDIRNCINKVQELRKEGITLENIGVSLKVLNDFIDLVFTKKDFTKARMLMFNNIKGKSEFLGLLYSLHDKVFFSEKLSNERKEKIISMIGESEYILNNCPDIETQISCTILRLKEC